MREHSAQNSREWFEKAVRVYVEGHQACAWCGERYQVYKGHRSTRLEYYCPGCEFYVCHDLVTGQYYVAPGVETGLEEQLSSSPIPGPSPA